MIKKLILIVASVGLLLIPATASAASTTAITTPTKQMAVCASSAAANFFGFQPWYACLEQKYGSTQIKTLNDVFLIIFPLVDALIKAAVYVAIVYIFWMLIKIILARGESGKIAQASMGIRDAVIGMVIALIAVAIINFITGAIIG